MTSFDDLPDEMVTEIFMYLPLKDRKQARLVNKRFYELSNEKRVIKNDVAVAQDIKGLTEMSGHFRHINLRIRKFTKTGHTGCREFFTRNGAIIKYIEFQSIRYPIANHLLGTALKECVNVEHIFLRGIGRDDDWPLKSSVIYTSDMNKILLPKLRSLELIRFPVVSDGLINSILDNTQGLKRLKICFVSKKQEHAAINLLPSSVEELHLSGTNDVLLSQIAERVGKNLQRFYIYDTRDNTEASFRLIANKFNTTLREIDISISTNFTDTLVSQFLDSVKKLEKISLRQKRLSSAAFIAIRNLPDLRAIDLSHCQNVSSQDLITAFGTEMRPKILDLRLDCLYFINDNVLTAICPNLPNLNRLSLGCCENITNTGFEAICQHNVKLQHLSISYCEGITTVTNLNRIKGLVRLCLIHCKWITMDSLIDLRLSKLEKIRLNLKFVETAKALIIFTNCSQLQVMFDESFSGLAVTRELTVSAGKWNNCRLPELFTC